MTQTTTAAVVTKADKARAIFAEMHGKEGVARKDVIAKIMIDCELGKAAASTYYQNAKDKAGLVVKKAPAVETAPAEVTE